MLGLILSNRYAQGALVIAAALLGFKLYGEKRERDGRIEARRKVTRQIEEQTDERISNVRAVERELADTGEPERLRNAAASPHNRRGLRSD